MGAYVDSNLAPGEVVVYQTSVHPIVYVPPAFFVLLGIGFGAYGIRDVGLVLLGLALLGLAGAWIRQTSSEFAVTNRRVIVKLGFISSRTIEINMSKVESIEVNQDIFGRMFNYGTILVIGTGGTKEPFTLINDPLAFRRAVQSQQG